MIEFSKQKIPHASSNETFHIEPDVKAVLQMNYLVIFRNSLVFRMDNYCHLKYFSFLEHDIPDIIRENDKVNICVKLLSRYIFPSSIHRKTSVAMH